MPRTNFVLSLALVAALALSAQNKPRIFVSASDYWAIQGSAGDLKGGSRPQTVQVMTDFKERCPEVTVTLDKSKADFTVLFDVRDDYPTQMAVFDRSGDLIFTGSTRTLGNAVKDACEAIKKVRADRK